MNTWILVYNQDVNFESPSYQSRSLAYSKQIKSGDKVLMSREGFIVGEAFVNGDPNVWDNLVLSLAGIKRVATPYPTPDSTVPRSFAITPLNPEETQ
jgi:hypothetical protein